MLTNFPVFHKTSVVNPSLIFYENIQLIDFGTHIYVYRNVFVFPRYDGYFCLYTYTVKLSFPHFI